MKHRGHICRAIGIRGVFAMLLGLIAFAWPMHTMRALVYLFGLYALIDGLFAFWGGTHAGTPRLVRSFFAEGVIGVGLGIFALVNPHLTILALVYIFAAWALLTGLFEIFASNEIASEAPGGQHLTLIGLLSIVCGALLIAAPNMGIIALAYLLGAIAFVSGLLLVMLAFRLHAIERQIFRLHMDGV